MGLTSGGSGEQGASARHLHARAGSSVLVGAVWLLGAAPSVIPSPHVPSVAPDSVLQAGDTISHPLARDESHRLPEARCQARHSGRVETG